MLNSTIANQLPGPPHFVDLHVNPGESVSIQFFDGNETILRGPTTIKMISQHAYPPMPMPVQVPPGHMIQQIVDENGTLRHIILSVLTNGNTNGNNYSNSTSQFVSQQQSYCCCCYNACSSGNSVQTSITSPVANQQLQPQLNHNQMVFPLNSHSFVRHRRSSRNYSSNKRSNINSNYYSTNSIGKVNSSRYKSDNHKANYQNRYSTNLNYDSLCSYDSSNDTKYYLNKSYDYSCNSSNASQASTIDQINDNLKYYKDDSYGIDDEYVKKMPFDSSDLNKNQDSSSFCLDCNNKNVNLTNDEILSQKSSLNEDIDNYNDQDSSLSTPTVNLTDINKDSNFINDEPGERIYLTQESELNDSSINAVDPKAANDMIVKSIKNQKMDFLDNESTNDLSINDSLLKSLVKEEKSKEQYCPTENNQINKNRTDSISLSDNTKLVENGNMESYYPTFESFHETCYDYNESDKTDSDEYHDEESGQIYDNSNQTSPNHLLPKIEAINLTYNSLSPGSLRLKWFFNQPNEHPEHKKHFIVNMLMSNLEDSPNSRIVHQGHTMTCRVSHLHPQKKYTFRVRTSTENAVLISNLLTVITPEQSISGTKTNGRKSKQQLQQQLLQQQQQIFQQQQLLRQQQHFVEESQVTSSGHGLMSRSGLTSDQRCAILILIGFTFFALIVAVIIQNLLGSTQ